MTEQSPFASPAAFAPFFREAVAVEGRREAIPALNGGGTVARSVRGTFRACVMDCGFAEPLADGDATCSARVYAVSVRKGDWVDRTPPRVGDRVRATVGGRSASLVVTSVSCGEDVWTAEAREVLDG